MAFLAEQDLCRRGLCQVSRATARSSPQRNLPVLRIPARAARFWHASPGSSDINSA
jgi:hypothetical protein